MIVGDTRPAGGWGPAGRRAAVSLTADHLGEAAAWVFEHRAEFPAELRLDNTSWDPATVRATRERLVRGALA